MATVRPVAGLCLILASGPLVSACRIEGGAPVTRADTIPGIETQIVRMLERSASAWNDGNLDAFMNDYLRAPTTTYMGSGGLVSGWEAIRARYAPLFQAGALRDSLRFEDVTGRPLGSDHALATARYVLFRDGRVTASGPFTLVLWRTEDGWRIVHDQSASDPPGASGEDGGEATTETPADEAGDTPR